MNRAIRSLSEQVICESLESESASEGCFDVFSTAEVGEYQSFGPSKEYESSDDDEEINQFFEKDGPICYVRHPQCYNPRY
ncbi:hypothetical protein ENUP19_0352G0011 [Entamoeba nuttalli]|uniref:Uncharacterized protein n=2 Tax=Entamoeba nuttalli TaxID=412467 RepID=K2GUF2_ENTNP|nr:hypothetical protein ENU1_195300 [Entamoeba nuttalli P19]EKE37497.1 hypothetical protein ENU1_195300 [Entamoeba nuttalli P19]|eukprot:XP_008860167.1 hypothetical protein ENU1_195300 [Entamoeba nuttalli P19]